MLIHILHVLHFLLFFCLSMCGTGPKAVALWIYSSEVCPVPRQGYLASSLSFLSLSLSLDFLYHTHTHTHTPLFLIPPLQAWQLPNSAILYESSSSCSWANKAVCFCCLFFSLQWYSCLALATHLIVGKTSLITRFMYDTFDNTYQVNGLSKRWWIMHLTFWASGHDWYRLSFKDHVPWRSYSAPSVMGYSRTGTWDWIGRVYSCGLRSYLHLNPAFYVFNTPVINASSLLGTFPLFDPILYSVTITFARIWCHSNPCHIEILQWLWWSMTLAVSNALPFHYKKTHPGYTFLQVGTRFQTQKSGLPMYALNVATKSSLSLLATRLILMIRGISINAIYLIQ